MLSFDEASRRLLARARLTDPAPVNLADALGRVLAEPRVVAAVDVPPFANSAMDGFALRSADAPGTLRVVGEVRAGTGSLPEVGPGEAVRIMTGAPLPPGADTVLPIEEAIDDDATVTVPAAPSGLHVRAAAHDTRAGDEICLAEALTPASIGVLASLGLGEVQVRRRPLVAILATGDELVGPGEPLEPGQIHDVNAVALAAAVVDAGGVALPLPRVRDQAGSIQQALTRAARDADLVVTSGGVSVGQHDYVRAVLEQYGSLDFWRIAVQPGKPLAVGELGGVTVIGLPGNPVSALVTFELFVRPLIRAMQGMSGDGRHHLRARATERMPKDPDRRAFLRVRAQDDGADLHAMPAGGQQSSQLRPMADGNALLVVPEGADAAEPDQHYEAILLQPLALAGR